MATAKIHRLRPGAQPRTTAAKSVKAAKIKRELFTFAPLLAQPAPTRMEPEAADLFAKLTAELAATGAHAEADLLLLEQLVDAIIAYREARRLMKTEGSIYTTEKGARVTHPAFFLLNAERQTILSLAAMLLLSPRARGGQLSKSISEAMDEPAEEPAEDEVEDTPATASGEF